MQPALRYHRAGRRPPLRILVVTARPPWPPRRGDQARAAGLIETLVGRHRIRVLALRPPGFACAPAPPAVGVDTISTGWGAHLGALAMHPRIPIQVAMHRVARLEREARRAVEDFAPEVVLVVLSRLGGLIDRLDGVPVVLDLVDSLALNLENRARRQPLLAPLLRREARLMARWDRSLLTRVFRATVVSERDRNAVTTGARTLASKVTVVPFGVPAPAHPPAPRQGRGIVLLSGNLGYFPTVDGARWFAGSVWPSVREVLSDTEWWLAGARPGRAVRRLARAPGVTLFADPVRLAPLQEQASVAVAPMRSGSGTPIKVLEAMACGLPVVASPAAAAGLDGVPAGAIRVASGAAAFAEAVRELLADRERAARQASAAWEWVRSTHSIEATTAAFETILTAAAATKG